jgi:hypothetical protein
MLHAPSAGLRVAAGVSSGPAPRACHIRPLALPRESMPPFMLGCWGLLERQVLAASLPRAGARTLPVCTSARPPFGEWGRFTRWRLARSLGSEIGAASGSVVAFVFLLRGWTASSHGFGLPRTAFNRRFPAFGACTGRRPAAKPYPAGASIGRVPRRFPEIRRLPGPQA